MLFRSLSWPDTGRLSDHLPVRVRLALTEVPEPSAALPLDVPPEG